jgi:formimidoylglutamate deiminase
VSGAQVVEADLTWTGERFEPGVQIAIGEDGRIAAAGRLGQRPTRRLPERALLPGFVNAHSHAFQRALRGRGERFPAGAGSFWTWREAMYELVEQLDAETFHAVCVQAFGEMLDAGITTVGEFHYFHHSSPGATDFALDRIVLRAAGEAGIRIALLNTYYVTGGVGRPLAGAQRRFDGISLASYWAQLDRLDALRDPATQTLGAVAHSVRAASPGDIKAIHGEARRRGLVFHMHVEEQPAEVDDCVAAYGRRPLALVNEMLEAEPHGFTGVHCTQSEPAELERFLTLGGTVCVCPSTEAHLGDGIPRWARAAHPVDGRLCFGSDANSRISFFQEMRWLEYGQRLLRQARGILTDAEGQVARPLLRVATEAGARALGVPTGRIAEGRWADFAVVNLTEPVLANIDASVLLDALVFGADNEVIAGTCVGGRWRDRR